MNNYFSTREGHQSFIPDRIVFDDAPQSFRFAYFEDILFEYSYVEDDRWRRDGKPVGLKTLYRKLCRLLHMETDDVYFDSFYTTGLMREWIKDIEWFVFFDVLELVGEEITSAFLDMEEYGINAYDVDSVFWIATSYKFHNYMKAVNVILKKYNIGWRINEESRLERTDDSNLREKVLEVQKNVDDKYSQAKMHLEKAERFAFQRPLDPENSIKESICAIESIGKTIFPKCSTLGDIIKELKKQSNVPMLTSIIDKFWKFSNATPDVRHGGTKDSNLAIYDAEFCLHVGTALVKYLNDYSKNRKVD